MINKLLQKIYYLILIMVPLGWLLNYRYYWARFVSEGFEPWLCIVISITLVVFASIAFAGAKYFKADKKKVWILCASVYAVLAFYSINCTTAGQYADQQTKNEELNTFESEKDNTTYIITQYQKNIVASEKEIERFTTMIDNSIENLSDAYDFKNTLAITREEKEKEQDKKALLEKELNALLVENKISIAQISNREKSKSLYVFYAALIWDMSKPENKSKPEIVQFIFQVILSIIIEMIAQLSIFIFMSIGVSGEPAEEKKITIRQNELNKFAFFAFENINLRNPPFLNLGNDLIVRIKKVCPLFTDEIYRCILRVGIKNDLIKKQGKGFIPGADYVDGNFFYQQMCNILKFNLQKA